MAEAPVLSGNGWVWSRAAGVDRDLVPAQQHSLRVAAALGRPIVSPAVPIGRRFEAIAEHLALSAAEAVFSTGRQIQAEAEKRESRDQADAYARCRHESSSKTPRA